LLQTRFADGPPDSPLEALLRDARPEVHDALAGALVAAPSADDAMARALSFHASLPVPSEAGELEVAASEIAG
jgi:hypothetical protein